MIEDKFGLEDESYWTDPWANRKAVQRPLMSAGQETFLIGAPKVVALDRHRSLPLAVLRTRKAQGGSPVDFRASAVLAAWDKNLGRLHARLAFPEPPPAPAPRGSAPAAAGKGDSFSGDPTAMVAEASTLDVAARLGLPLVSGEYVIALLCLNQAANRCKTDLIDSIAFQDAEAAAYVRALREEELGPPRVHPEPGQGMADYGKQEKSPGIPDEIGIALSVQRVTVLRADRPCVLHGSFRLPVAAPEGKPAAAKGDPTAIVPIGLLLTGSVEPAPLAVNLSVPSYAPLSRDGAQWVATGYFSLDLCAHARLARAVQTYFLYAFSGEAMAGPALAAFVNPVLTWKTKEEFARETEGAVR